MLCSQLIFSICTQVNNIFIYIKHSLEDTLTILKPLWVVGTFLQWVAESNYNLK